MKRKIISLIFTIALGLISTSLFAGGLPTFDITAMLNWITEFATNTEDKIKEKLVWAQDIKTAMEHYKEIQNYWEQMKGIGDKFNFDGLWKSLELVGKMQQETHKMVQDADDAGKAFKIGLKGTWEDMEKITSGEYFEDAESDFIEAWNHQNPEERFNGIMKAKEKEIGLCNQAIKEIESEMKVYEATEAKKWCETYEKMYSMKAFFDIQASRTPYAIKQQKRKSPIDGREDIEMYVKEIDLELAKIDEVQSVSDSAQEKDISKYLDKEAYNQAAVEKICLYNANAAKTEAAKEQWKILKMTAETNRDSFNDQSSELDESLEDAMMHVKDCQATINKLTEAKRDIEKRKTECQRDYNMTKDRLDRHRRNKSK